MSLASPSLQLIPVSRIFLDLQNPRHVPYDTEEEAISYLCKHENVVALARDIAKKGLNPLDLFALIPNQVGKGEEQTYTVAEGNRRMCALKLLHDPDRSPSEYRQTFLQESQHCEVKTADAMSVIFSDRDQVKDWLMRIHGGEQEGIGRRRWLPEQKMRHAGDRKNLLADAILDYAVQKEFITSDQRKGRLTTAQRYLEKESMKGALGLQGDSVETLARTRPVEDFDELVKRFSTDLIEKTIHSRHNTPEIDEYAKSLVAESGISETRTSAKTILNSAGQVRKVRSPQKPLKTRHVIPNEIIEERLQKLGKYKLQKLYFSICQISVEAHTPLIAIGVWSFFETLTAVCGRSGDVSFKDFLSKSRLTSLGLVGRDVQNPVIQAIGRIADYGNTTKHHDIGGNFNFEQIVVDMETLNDLIQRLADAKLAESKA